MEIYAELRTHELQPTLSQVLLAKFCFAKDLDIIPTADSKAYC
jgi:hypothetical protein